MENLAPNWGEIPKYKTGARFHFSLTDTFFSLNSFDLFFRFFIWFFLGFHFDFLKLQWHCAFLDQADGWMHRNDWYSIERNSLELNILRPIWLLSWPATTSLSHSKQFQEPRSPKSPSRILHSLNPSHALFHRDCLVRPGSYESQGHMNPTYRGVVWILHTDARQWLRGAFFNLSNWTGLIGFFTESLT